MDVKEAQKHLNSVVIYKDPKLGIDGEYKLNGIILRRDKSGFVFSAELLDKCGRSVTYTDINKIELRG